MENYQHKDNGEHSFTRVQEFTERPPQDADAKEPRQDEGRVGAFDAKAEEIGNKADAPAAIDKKPGENHEQGRVGKFSANAEELDGKEQTLGDIGHGFCVYGWQRQLVDFYGMRLRKNVEFGRRLAEVDGIADLIGAQGEYVRGTLLDYMSSFRSLYGFGLHGPQQTTERPNR